VQVRCVRDAVLVASWSRVSGVRGARLAGGGRHDRKSERLLDMDERVLRNVCVRHGRGELPGLQVAPVLPSCTPPVSICL
jgi:hypothetical protein